MPMRNLPVYVDEALMARLPAAMSDETDMLKDLTSPRQFAPVLPDPAHRRSDGLRVTIAPEE
jgi:hypothetical protein